jgi:hypothetical protein
MGDEEREPRLFTLKEAERTRAEVEPILVEAIETRRRQSELAKELGGIASRIALAGGLVVRYDDAAKLRIEHDKLAAYLKAALEKIESTGCVVKDLEVGLLDFPSIIGNEEVYLCWRLGEDRIRFYHGLEEGFAGRKPLDPHDAGPSQTIQ